MRIVTHNGVFHADDVCGVAVRHLLATLRGNQVSIIRTRDLTIAQGGDIVIDVGGKNAQEGDVIYLDHHQRGGAGARSNGIPYAAVGLVWKTFGRELIGLLYPVDQNAIEQIWSTVDRDFVSPVDAGDCGYELANGWRGEVRPLTFSGVIYSLNPSWCEEQNFDAAFESAVHYAKTALMRAIADAYGKVLALGNVEAALKKRTDKRLLLLDKLCPWQDAVFALPGGDEVILVVFKQSGDGNETWLVQAVPDKPGSFGMRKPLPQSWGGQRDSAFQCVTEVGDAIFCHPGLFICGAGSKEGALQLAQLALA